MNIQTTVENVTLIGENKKCQKFPSEGLPFFLICFHCNATLFLKVLSLKTL